MTTTTPTTSTSASARTIPSTAAMIAGQSRWEIIKFFKRFDNVFFIFLFPSLMFALFATIFSNSNFGEFKAAQYFLPAMLGQGFMVSSFQLVAMKLATDRDSGALKRFRITPMNAFVYFISKVVMMVVATLLSTALLFCVGVFGFGVEPPSASGWVTLAWVFVLSVLCGTVLGVALGSVLKDANAANAIVTPIIIILPFISGVYFQWDALPGWLQKVASVFPLRWQVQASKSAFLPEEFATATGLPGWQVGTSALILGVWSVVGLVLAWRNFSWSRSGDK